MLSSEFWRAFAQRHWEKSPCVIHRPFVRPLLTPERLFPRLVAAVYGESDGERNCRFYIKRALLESEIERYLPRRADRSLGRFAARINSQLRGQKFGLAADRYHVYDAATWLRLRDFLGECVAATGSTVREVEGSVFVGNYARTPFGIHRDRHGTFLFVIAGTKRMLVWPTDPRRARGKRATEHDYRSMRRGALVLEGGAGDVIYWPRSFWHVAESTGGLAASLHLAVVPDGDDNGDVADAVVRIVRSDLMQHPARVNSLTFDRDVSTTHKIDKFERHVAQRLRTLSRGARLRQDLRVIWLKRLTSGGFSRVPAPRPLRQLSDNCVLQCDPRHPVVWIRARNALLCAANGHCFSVSARAGFTRLIGRINSGEPFTIRTLSAPRARSKEPRLKQTELRRFLEKLVSLRACDRAHAAGQRKQKS